MGTRSRVPELGLRAAEGLLAAVLLGVVDLRVAFPAHGARSSFVLLFLCDAAALALLAHAARSVAKGAVLGSFPALAPMAYSLLPGSDPAGAPWAWLFAIARLPALGSAAALALWFDVRDRWAWAALAIVAAPPIAILAAWSAGR